jgi:hypothetical protein
VKSAANTEWPLPMPDYLLPLLTNRSKFSRPASSHFDVLIDMAIADHRHDDVLRWYDAMSAGQQYRGSMTWYGSGGYGDRVAAAVTESHPERSLAIYRQLVPGGGLEPPRPCGLRILSPLRLPISPSGHTIPDSLMNVHHNNSIVRLALSIDFPPLSSERLTNNLDGTNDRADHGDVRHSQEIKCMFR